MREPVHGDAFLMFGGDGAVQGSDGTNAVSGRFGLSRAGITISDGATSGVGLTATVPKVRRDLQAAFAELLSGKRAMALLWRGTLILYVGDWDVGLARPAGASG